MRQLSRFPTHILDWPDRLGPPSRSLVSVPRRGSRRDLLAGELLPRLISGRRGERTKEQDRFRCQRTEHKRSATDADDATSSPPRSVELARETHLLDPHLRLKLLLRHLVPAPSRTSEGESVRSGVSRSWDSGRWLPLSKEKLTTPRPCRRRSSRRTTW